MSKQINLIYFSPTGGTLKVSQLLCKSLTDDSSIRTCNMTNRNISETELEKLHKTPDLTVVAAPVFAGRIPKIMIDRITSYLSGNNSPAIALAVYGNRAFEDALLELSNTLKSNGFHVVGAGAFIAQHSLYNLVAANRPDKKDFDDITEFAQKISAKLSSTNTTISSDLNVPGNYPYKEHKNMTTPFTSKDCTLCKSCIDLCPVSAISINDNSIITNSDLCILCAACVSKCPANSRIIPQEAQEHTKQLLSAYVNIRSKNEYYL